MAKLIYRLSFLLFTLFVFFLSTMMHAQTETETVLQEVEMADNEEVVIPIAVLENAPRPKKCEESTKNDAFNCFKDFINNHVRKHFRYPKEARKKDIQGKVMVMFVIDKKGKVTDIKTRAPRGCEILEQEAIRIIELLPKVLPGTQRGKPVRVSYALPISFVLTE